MRVLLHIAVGCTLVGLGMGFAPSASGTFVGATALGMLIIATGVFHPMRPL